MKVLLFNDTDHVWKRHIGGRGPLEIPPHTGDVIYLFGPHEAAFVKVWDGVFLVRGMEDDDFAGSVGDVVGAKIEA